MNILAPDTVRNAALALHALAPADRNWLVGRLSAQQQALLTPLLKELQDLGIPEDPELVRRAVAQVRATGAVVPGSKIQMEPSGASSEIAAAAGKGRLQGPMDAEVLGMLADILRGEPPKLVAFLLAMRPWSWEPQLLALLGAAHQRRVQEVLEQLRSSSAVLTASPMDGVLLQAIEQALQTATVRQEALLSDRSAALNNNPVARLLRHPWLQGWSRPASRRHAASRKAP